MLAVDCLLTQDAFGLWDIEWTVDGDFVMTDTLTTAVIMSLTCERRAKEYEILEPEYRRGWIGNLLYEDVDHEDGCGNWLYEQKRLNSKTVNGVRDESEKGLLWMQSDDVVKQSSVDVGVYDAKVVIDVTLQLKDGTYTTISL